jgi:hypothetical protein
VIVEIGARFRTRIDTLYIDTLFVHAKDVVLATVLLRIEIFQI